MNKLLTKSLLCVFAILTPLAHADFIPVPRYHPKLKIFGFVDPETFSAPVGIFAIVTDLDEWEKSSVTHFGCNVYCKDEGYWIVTAHVTKDQLDTLLEQPFVKLVEIPRKLSIPRCF